MDDNDDSEIKWAEPPSYALFVGSGKQPGRYMEFAAQLKESPKRWAVLPGGDKTSENSAKATAQNIRRGKIKGFDDGKFETAVDGLTIYVRFVGKPEPKVDTPDDDGAAPAIRDWARTQGLEVPDRGRLPAHLVEAYRSAH